jgi:hypothetical protein
LHGRDEAALASVKGQIDNDRTLVVTGDVTKVGDLERIPLRVYEVYGPVKP